MQHSKAFAYVRPHDLDVQRHSPGATGIVARLVRTIVMGPLARLKLIALDASAAGGPDIIEAHIPALQFQALGLQTGDTLVLTPRRARVFVV